MVQFTFSNKFSEYHISYVGKINKELDIEISIIDRDIFFFINPKISIAFHKMQQSNLLLLLLHCETSCK